MELQSVLEYGKASMTQFEFDFRRVLSFNFDDCITLSN
mgnify:CR=1 FL=1